MEVKKKYQRFVSRNWRKAKCQASRTIEFAKFAVRLSGKSLLLIFALFLLGVVSAIAKFAKEKRTKDLSTNYTNVHECRWK